MADRRRDADAADDGDVGSARDGRPGTARWQKVVGIVALLVLLVLGVLLFGGDGHGPGRHGLPERLEQETDRGDGGGHDPSQREHSGGSG